MAAATLVAGLTVAGCAANPGAAAVVDGHRIAESHLADAVADFNAITGQPVDPSAMLGTLIIGPILFDVAAQQGIAATDEEAAALLDQQVVASGTALPEEPYSEGVLDVARIAIVNQSLMATPGGEEAQAMIGERIAAADVDVSPRYGTFDPMGAVQPSQFSWITSGDVLLDDQPAG